MAFELVARPGEPVAPEPSLADEGVEREIVVRIDRTSERQLDRLVGDPASPELVERPELEIGASNGDARPAFA